MNPEPRAVRRVVVPVGGTDREYLAQEQAVEMAAALGAPVFGLHIHTDVDPPRAVFQYLEQQCERWGVPLETRALGGTDAAAELLQETGPMDLVVIGTRRLGGAFHLGSVANRLIQEGQGPVQVVRLGA